MKVLFVCRANSGRSQMAMELYNQLQPGEAESAGTHVDEPGQMLKDRPTAASAIAAMRDIGVDMSNNTRRQLTPDMLNDYDHIVVLAEAKAIPSFLNTWPGAEMWHIEDTKRVDHNRAAQVREIIYKRVRELARRLHQPQLV